MIVIGVKAGFTPSNSTRLTLNLRLFGLLITIDPTGIFALAVIFIVGLFFLMISNSSTKLSTV